MLLGQIAPTFLDAVGGVIIVQVREDLSPGSAIVDFRIIDLNNGKLFLYVHTLCM